MEAYSSLACCVGVSQQAPELGECATPLGSLGSVHALQPFFVCLVTEFRDNQVTWEDIVPLFPAGNPHSLRLNVYVWPMIIVERHNGGKMLLRHSLIK